MKITWTIEFLENEDLFLKFHSFSLRKIWYNSLFPLYFFSQNITLFQHHFSGFPVKVKIIM